MKEERERKEKVRQPNKADWMERPSVGRIFHSCYLIKGEGWKGLGESGQRGRGKWGHLK